MPAKKTFNPFYVLLIPAGLVFAVTAFAYGYMAFQAVNAIRAEAGAHAGHPLFQWLRAHGDAALLIELALLAVLTVAAIATDKIWDRAAQERQESNLESPRPEDAKELSTK
ncbi:MAG: hypothetical protein C0485_02070 [Pirellula sp.]|nr:hypothetical protein [Pirellula sp.]